MKLVARGNKSSLRSALGLSECWSAARLGLRTGVVGFVASVGCLVLVASAAADQGTTLSGNYTGVSDTQPSGLYCGSAFQLIDPLSVTVSGTNITLDASFRVQNESHSWSAGHGTFVGTVSADNTFTATGGSGVDFSGKFVETGSDIRFSGTLTEAVPATNAPQTVCVHQVTAQRTITGGASTPAPESTTPKRNESSSVPGSATPSNPTSPHASGGDSSAGGIDPLIPVAIGVAFGGGIAIGVATVGVSRGRRSTATSSGPPRDPASRAPPGPPSGPPVGPPPGPPARSPLGPPSGPSIGPPPPGPPVGPPPGPPVGPPAGPSPRYPAEPGYPQQ